MWLIGNKALEFKKKTSRIYPQKNLFSHVLGQTDDINEGISGIERFFEKDLSNKKVDQLFFKNFLTSDDSSYVSRMMAGHYPTQ